MTAPKAFLCHASEDKDRFARPFAAALRAAGVDVFLDEWEVLPGDSLPQKIFDVGLKDAEVIIAILSPASVTKPWVSAELDVAVIKKIDGEVRLIPVILDLNKALIPESLRALRWVRVPDVSNFGEQLGEVLDVIFSRNRRPPLGPEPGFAESITAEIDGLNTQDVVVLKAIFESGIEAGLFSVSTGKPAETAMASGASEEAFADALEVLESHGFAALTRVLGGHASQVELTLYAIDECCKYWLPDYDRRMRTVVAELVNHSENRSNDRIAESVNESLWFVTFVLDRLAAQGLIHVSPSFVGFRRLSVWKISPELKRSLG